jgi:sarcosine oxidase subunit gamma
MPAHITRVSADVYEVMVMRSMAQTLLHDLTRAATGIAARG